MTILAPGTEVLIGHPRADIPAIILSVQLFADSSHQYQVEWWDGRVRYAEWVGEGSVKPIQPKWLDVEPSTNTIAGKGKNP